MEEAGKAAETATVMYVSTQPRGACCIYSTDCARLTSVVYAASQDQLWLYASEGERAMPPLRLGGENVGLSYAVNEIHTK